jgi:hypothetical protein
MSGGPKILYLDIETTPILAHTWGMRNQFINLNQIIENPRMFAFGAKWRGEKTVKFFSEYHHGRDVMLEQVHTLLDAADLVAHYNGNGFDIPWINGELAVSGYTPPSPFKNLDLYRVVAKNFRWPSMKLQYVASRLLDDTKVSHTGHQMWIDCLLGDEETKAKAWALMRKYCKQDVALLEPLHDKLTPWLANQFNPALFSATGELACSKAGCGSTDLEKRGTAYTQQRAFPQYRCRKCGGWTRDTKSSWAIHSTGVAR